MKNKVLIEKDLKAKVYYPEQLNKVKLNLLNNINSGVILNEFNDYNNKFENEYYKLKAGGYITSDIQVINIDDITFDIFFGSYKVIKNNVYYLFGDYKLTDKQKDIIKQIIKENDELNFDDFYKSLKKESSDDSKDLIKRLNKNLKCEILSKFVNYKQDKEGVILDTNMIYIINFNKDKVNEQTLNIIKNIITSEINYCYNHLKEPFFIYNSNYDVFNSYSYKFMLEHKYANNIVCLDIMSNISVAEYKKIAK